MLLKNDIFSLKPSNMLKVCYFFIVQGPLHFKIQHCLFDVLEILYLLS